MERSPDSKTPKSLIGSHHHYETIEVSETRISQSKWLYFQKIEDDIDITIDNNQAHEGKNYSAYEHQVLLNIEAAIEMVQYVIAAPVNLKNIATDDPEIAVYLANRFFKKDCQRILKDDYIFDELFASGANTYSIFLNTIRRAFTIYRQHVKDIDTLDTCIFFSTLMGYTLLQGVLNVKAYNQIPKILKDDSQIMENLDTAYEYYVGQYNASGNPWHILFDHFHYVGLEILKRTNQIIIPPHRKFIIIPTEDPLDDFDDRK